MISVPEFTVASSIPRLVQERTHHLKCGLCRRVRRLAPAPLGAISVYYGLNPYLVISHLLLSLTVLGLGVLVLLEANRLVRGGAAALPMLARAGGAALLVAIAVLVVTGTLSTA